MTPVPREPESICRSPSRRSVSGSSPSSIRRARPTTCRRRFVCGEARHRGPRRELRRGARLATRCCARPSPAVQGRPRADGVAGRRGAAAAGDRSHRAWRRSGARERAAPAGGGGGRRPFDLARGPLLRTTLLRLGSDEHVLLVTMHHVISNGWTIGILVRELGALYRASVEGARLPCRRCRCCTRTTPGGSAAARRTGDGRTRRLVAAAPGAAAPACWRCRPTGAPGGADPPRRAAVADSGAGGGRGGARLEPARGATCFLALLAGFSTC